MLILNLAQKTQTSIQHFQASKTLFWKTYPSTPFALGLFCGYLSQFVSWLALLPLLLAPWQGAVTALLATCHLLMLGPGNIPESGPYLFHIDKLTERSFHSTEFYHYTGHLESGKRAVCRLPKSAAPYDAGFSYWIDGEIQPISEDVISLKPNGNWQMHEKGGLAGLRYEAKKAISAPIREATTDSKTANLLVGLATGDFFDTSVSLDLAHLGLQHITAISGFHFAIVATCVLSVISVFCTPSWARGLLMAALFAYYLFIGPSASVVRAFFMSLLALLAQLLNRQAKSLHILGIVAMFMLLVEPALAKHMGFALSFAATLGILLLYEPIDRLCQQFFGRTTIKMVAKRSFLTQHRALILHFFRKALALNLAVHIATWPLLLLFQERFYLLSLVYNLYVPFLISFSLLGLVLAFMLAWLPPISAVLLNATATYTGWILALCASYPKSLDFCYRGGVEPLFITVYYTLLLAICLRQKASDWQAI